MDTQSNKPLHPMIWVAGIAVILFSVVGIAAIMGWLPASMGALNNSNLHATDKQSTNASSPSPTHTHKARHVPKQAICKRCGVIESIREINTQGKSSGVGVVSGAVVGGVLGNQIGDGRGRDLATVVGAMGGAVAGNQIEKSVKSSRSYDITVRLDNGSSRVIHEIDPPTWQVGERVRIVNGAIRSNG